MLFSGMEPKAIAQLSQYKAFVFHAKSSVISGARRPMVAYALRAPYPGKWPPWAFRHRN